jgi:hypothetical protein
MKASRGRRHHGRWPVCKEWPVSGVENQKNSDDTQFFLNFGHTGNSGQTATPATPATRERVGALRRGEGRENEWEVHGRPGDRSPPPPSIVANPYGSQGEEAAKKEKGRVKGAA